MAWLSDPTSPGGIRVQLLTCSQDEVTLFILFPYTISESPGVC